jgi:hypothetical protein
MQITEAELAHHRAMQEEARRAKAWLAEQYRLIEDQWRVKHSPDCEVCDGSGTVWVDCCSNGSECQDDLPCGCTEDREPCEPCFKLNNPELYPEA